MSLKYSGFENKPVDSAWDMVYYFTSQVETARFSPAELGSGTVNRAIIYVRAVEVGIFYVAEMCFAGRRTQI